MQRAAFDDLDWVTASFCNQANCVQAAPLDQGASVALSDSKNPGTVLVLSAPEWSGFLDAIADGDFSAL